MKSKDILLQDAVKTAIKLTKQNITLKRLLLISVVLNVASLIILYLAFIGR